MKPIERRLQVVLSALVLVHLAGSLWWPAALWGVSHQAVWPPALALAWTGLALAAILAAPRLASIVDRVPRGRVALVLLPLLAGLAFWLLRERTHFFGDGTLILRGGGLSASSFARAPLLVRPIFALASTAEQQLGLPPETTIAIVSVVSGALVVWLALRLAGVLAASRTGRLTALALLASSGAVALFLGHIEYYAPLVPALLAYLWLGILGLRGRAPLWPTWLAFAVLCDLHLASIALAPGQIYLAWRGFRRGELLGQILVIPVAFGVGWGVRMLLGAGGAMIAALPEFALQRYFQPFFNPASSRHAFGLWSAAHAAAIANALFLVAPLAIAVAAVSPRLGRGSIHRFLGWAALGCLAFQLLFNSELGPYRDWDTLGPHSYVYLAWAAIVITSVFESGAFADSDSKGGGVVAVLLLVAGLHHVVPWIALQARSGAAESHLRLTLAHPNLWSPYARGVLHEEFAIAHRDRGNLAGAIADYESASRAEPADARYRLGLADSYAGAGDGVRAMQEYETSIRLRPNFAPAHNNYAAWLLRSNGDLDRALQHAHQAVLLAPGNPRFLVTLGTAEMRSGDLGKARAHLTRAHALAPGFEATEARLEELRAREREAASSPLPAP